MRSLWTKKAFTLVEMIIVIIIVALLAGIVLSRVGAVADDSRKGTAKGAASIVNKYLEAVHLAEEYAYPTNTTTANTFLNNTKYFPDGNPNSSLKLGHYIFYNSTKKRFYSN